MTKLFVNLGLFVLAATASAAELDVSILSGGRTGLIVPPGTRIDYVVLGDLRAEPGVFLASAGVEVAVDLAEPAIESPKRTAWLAWNAKEAVTAVPTLIGATDCLPDSTSAAMNTKASPSSIVLCRGRVTVPDEPGTYRLTARSVHATTMVPFGPAGLGWSNVPTRVGRVGYLVLEVTPRAPALIESYPPAGAIDARQPWSPDGTEVDGWTSFELTFVGDTSQLVPEDLVVTHTSDTPAPQIAALRVDGPSVFVVLTDIIEASAWTTISHVPSGTAVRIGYLPGDVNGDREAGTSDIVALIDHLSGQRGRPPYQTDIGRDGTTDAEDLSRLIDLLNGGEEYPVFLGTKLPE